MISLRKQFLFVHVPKTGGNSIQNILKNHSEDEIVTPRPHQDGIERFEVRNSTYKITKHSTLSHYKSVIDAATYRSLFKFAVMRNPWDMMISYYFSPHRAVTEWNRNDFIELMKTVPTLRHYICEDPVSDQEKVDADLDLLMRFERLDDDFRTVCARIGIEYAPLPRRNRSERAHYSQYYDEELIELVARRFSEEVSSGGYAFERRR